MEYVISNKPKIYVSGPFRAKANKASHWEQETNIREAEAAALQIAKLGGAPLCPHTMYRFFQGELDDNDWLDLDLIFEEVCDAVYFLPTWKFSEGANVEHTYAQYLEKKELYDMEEVKEFIHEYRRHHKDS